MTVLLTLWAGLAVGIGYEWALRRSTRRRFDKHVSEAIGLATPITPDDHHWMSRAGVSW